jgi:hypothetical protein
MLLTYPAGTRGAVQLFLPKFEYYLSLRPLEMGKGKAVVLILRLNHRCYIKENAYTVSTVINVKQITIGKP